MAYINTKTVPITDYSIMSVFVRPYSRLLKVMIKRKELILLFISENHKGGENTKLFNFKLIKGIYQTDSYIDNEYDFFDTIRVVDDDNIDYYHVFYQEIKTINEERNEKIDNFLNQEF